VKFRRDGEKSGIEASGFLTCCDLLCDMLNVQGIRKLLDEVVFLNNEEYNEVGVLFIILLLLDK
jgi:hypothetical protein